MHDYLAERLEAATGAGIDRDAIALDPGLGFGKNFEHSMSLMRHNEALLDLGRPILGGPSRKSFIGEALDGIPVTERVEGTAGAVAWLALHGAAHRPGPRRSRDRPHAPRDRGHPGGRVTLEKKTEQLSMGQVAYADEGSGPPVVLLHGFPTSSHLWRDLVPLLAPKFRVIAPDLVGYGDSEHPDDPERMTIRAQAPMVRELLRTLGVEEGIAIVGHDIGGGVAQLLALEGGVNAMVLVDSICFDSWPIDAVRQLQDAREEQVDADFVRAMIGITFDVGMSHPERLPAEDREEFLRPWLADPMAVIRAARGIDGVGLVGTEGALADLDARVLIVWGEDDPFQPAELAERLGDILPGATTSLLPGCSHFVTEDARETVLPLIAEYLRVHHLGESHAHHAGPVPIDLATLERPDPSPPEGFEDLG